MEGFPQIGQAGPVGQRLLHGRQEQDGFPGLGTDGRMYTDAEYEQWVRPTPHYRFREFDLNDVEDTVAFVKVCTSIERGEYTEKFRERAYDLQAGTYKVFLEWVEIYMQDARAVTEGLG